MNEKIVQMNKKIVQMNKKIVLNEQKNSSNKPKKFKWTKKVQMNIKIVQMIKNSLNEIIEKHWLIWIIFMFIWTIMPQRSAP